MPTPVANFHTHPLSHQVGGIDEPSRADTANAWHRGLPGIVISRTGIYAYGPERRQDITNRKGYGKPMAVESLAPHLVMSAAGGIPSTVARLQWPEGIKQTKALLQEHWTDLDSEHAFDSHEAHLPDVEVVYVEWSNHGVEYGAALVEAMDRSRVPF